MSEADDEEEPTDPNIQLPELAPLREFGGSLREEHTLDMDPLPPPPRHPNRAAVSGNEALEGPATDRPEPQGPPPQEMAPPPLPARHRVSSAPPRRAAVAPSAAPSPGARPTPVRSSAPDPRSALPPASRLPSVPMGAVARPIGEAPSRPQRPSERLPRTAEATRARRISNPPPPRRDSRPPPAVRPGSIPPSRMPKPTDPPPPRSELNPPQRQRLAQMETTLDGARSTIARQRNEIAELRERLDSRDERLDGLAEGLASAPSQEAIEERVRELEQRRDAIAAELRARMEHAEREVDGSDGRFAKAESRLDRLEEDGDTIRLRMRQETMGHRLSRIDARLGGMEEALADLRRSLAEAQARDHRLERLESLFLELTQEMAEERQRTGADALRERMDDLEALVVKSGAAIDHRRETLEAQLQRVERISESLPPAPALPSAAEAEQLTRIKGIGPKFARLLAGAGVTDLAQIAAWTDDDIEQIGKSIGVKASRIRKADWVGQASQLIA